MQPAVSGQQNVQFDIVKYESNTKQPRKGKRSNESIIVGLGTLAEIEPPDLFTPVNNITLISSEVGL